MPEKEDVSSGGAAEPVRRRPEDVVLAAMDGQTGLEQPDLEFLVNEVRFHFPPDMEKDAKAERVMMFLRSMMTDIRSKFPKLFSDMKDPAAKAHLAAALRRSGVISHDVCRAVIAIIDKRCKN